jgi:endonuclease III
MSTNRTKLKINQIKETLRDVGMNYNKANKITEYLQDISDESKILFKELAELKSQKELLDADKLINVVDSEGDKK